MQLHIIAIGKKKSEYDPMIATYQKRITSPFSLTYEILDPAGIDHREQSKAREAEKILSKITSSDEVILLDEQGKDLRTLQLAEHLHQKLLSGTKRLVFIIGGSYGLDDSLLAQGYARIRLGSLTLPHELARLVLVEQLYRVTNYLGGGKYHHE
jgi:23S rRNA (pseudouridine1915-N3)-methyltransferase